MKVKSTLTALAVGATMLLGTAAMQPLSASTEGVLGCWRTISDKDGKVKSKVCMWVSKKNGKMYGAIRQLYRPSEPNPKCTKCRGWRKNKPIKGLVIITGMKKGSDKWEGGYILDPNNGKTYRCLIWRKGNKLIVRGYIGFSWAGRSQTWIK